MEEGEEVKVSPFSGDYKIIPNIPIETVETDYNEESGETIVLVINEDLYFGDRMDNSLLFPNQLRENGVVVNDIPQKFDKG